MRRTVFMVLAALASGCGDGGSGKTRHHDDTPRLRLAAFTSASIGLDKQFSAYGRRSRRVSRIDAAAGVELWGEQVPCCFESNAALPGLDGATLLGSSGLLVVERGGGRSSFDGFAVDGGHLARAAGHPTYAALDGEGTSVRVVRRLAAGVWQDETLAVPAGLGLLQEAEPRIVAALAGDGRTLVLLRPTTGAIFVYGPVADGAPLGGSPRRCGPYGGGDEYRALAVSADGARLWLGDRASRVLGVSVAACDEGTTASEALLEPGEPVTSLDPQADGSLLVALANGKIHALDGDSLATSGQYGPVCEHADGVVAPTPELLIASCYETENATSGEATVVYSKSYARLVFRADNAFGPLIRQRDEDVAGVGADGETQTLHVLLDNALGVLETTELTSGVQSRRRGLFVRGLLD
jgi:hypothetical protein